MKSGVHYWEITIDKIVEADDIIIGIAQKGVDHTRKLFESGKFWGWICAGGRAIYPDITKSSNPPAVKNFGREEEKCKQGDTIGLILEFANGKGNLTYLKNGVSNLNNFD